MAKIEPRAKDHVKYLIVVLCFKSPFLTLARHLSSTVRRALELEQERISLTDKLALTGLQY